MTPVDAFVKLSTPTQRWLGGLVLLATGVMTAALGMFDVQLRNRDAPSGIVSFELAGSLPAAQRILASWDARARIYAGLSLGLDYAYLLAYSTLLALVCAWASRRGPNAWRALGRWLCWGLWLAALCDACENVGLIALLLGMQSPAWPVVATRFAFAKFTLLAAGALYIIAGTAVRSLDRVSARHD
jgi:hypothetical protein